MISVIGAGLLPDFGCGKSYLLRMPTLHFTLDRAQAFVVADVRTPMPTDGTVRTHKQVRFELTSLGRKRLVQLRITGEGAKVPSAVLQELITAGQAKLNTLNPLAPVPELVEDRPMRLRALAETRMGQLSM